MNLRFIKHRLRKSEDGATAIEFAILVMPFMMLLMGIFEIGAMLLVNYSMDDGIADAARMIRTGQVDKKGITAAQFKEIACSKMHLVSDCTGKLYIDVRKFKDFASVNIPPALDEDGNLTGSVTKPSYKTGKPMDVVVVRAYYKWKFVTPLIGQFLANMGGNQRLLTTGAAFRNEPYGDS